VKTASSLKHVNICVTLPYFTTDYAVNVFAEYLEKCSIYWILDRCTTCAKKVQCRGE